MRIQSPTTMLDEVDCACNISEIDQRREFLEFFKRSVLAAYYIGGDGRIWYQRSLAKSRSRMPLEDERPTNWRRYRGVSRKAKKFQQEQLDG
ncbi:hypothetical protein KIN20_029837, partial [Parelaphostrongylus tenuis]